MIVAADRNNAIGYGNKIPWHLPKDFKYFKEITLGCTVIMGRLTMESLPFVLPGRRNIVLSKNKELILDGFEHAESIKKALEMISEDKEVFIIGGGEIYNKFLSSSSRIYKTLVDTRIEKADTYFPKISIDEWEIESSIPNEIDEHHKYRYYFNIYNRTSKT